jgi:phosphatidylethanolamine/phosphatidyl-N-methylethanolamine N-methyltransferase
MPWGSDRSDDSLSVATLDGNFIEQLYAQCASVYDWLFGPILQAGRREAMHQLALQPGNEILEIGIGTGLTTPLYPDDCRVTGIDVSEPMLREAARNIGHRHNIQLFRMDAGTADFS